MIESMSMMMYFFENQVLMIIWKDLPHIL